MTIFQAFPFENAPFRRKSNNCSGLKIHISDMKLCCVKKENRHMNALEAEI